MQNNRLRMPRRTGRMLCSTMAALSTILVASCATGPSRYLCPTLKEYPSAFQAEAAIEFAKSGKNVQQLVSDYGQLRDACRALQTK